MNRLKEKLKMKLTGALVAATTAQAFIIIVFAIFLIYNGYSRLAEKVIQEELVAGVYAAEQALDTIDPGAFTYKDGMFKKGSKLITEDSKVLDNLKSALNIDVTVAWNNTRVSSTLTNANGERVTGTTIDDAIVKKVLAGENVFVFTTMVQGTKYSAYYTPLRQPETDQIVGVLFAGKDKTDVNGLIQEQTNSTANVLLVVLVVVAVLNFFLVKTIAKSIKKVEDNLARVAHGDLNIEISPKLLKQYNEVGDIARSLNDVKMGLRSIAMDLHETSDEMNVSTDNFRQSFMSIESSIDNINVAVEEIAEGSTSQAQETTDASGKVLNMGKAIDSEVASVEELANASTTMMGYSDKANETLQELIDITGRTQDAVKLVSKQTEETNESAKNIQKAVSMISDIATQTNLLSLNASIEAARAGEAGRGFAVVANSIRELAEQSANSVKEIEEIITNLTQKSVVSFNTMGTVVENTNEQAEKIEDTKQVFDNLMNEVNRVNTVAKEIKSQTESLDVIKTNIADTVNTLASISQENAASTEETSSSMQLLTTTVENCSADTEKLVAYSNKLKEQANKFKL